MEKFNFKRLKKLSLAYNKISDIKVLEKVKFKELEELYLNNNKISDIKVFEKVKFEDLEELKLEGNKIDLTKNSLIISNLKSLLKTLSI